MRRMRWESMRSEIGIFVGRGVFAVLCRKTGLGTPNGSACPLYVAHRCMLNADWVVGTELTCIIAIWYFVAVCEQEVVAWRRGSLISSCYSSEAGLSRDAAMQRIYVINLHETIVGAVGLISIHLAFYQMNPWPTALRRILNLWKHMSSTPVEIFCILSRKSNKMWSIDCFARHNAIYCARHVIDSVIDSGW